MNKSKMEIIEEKINIKFTGEISIPKHHLERNYLHVKECRLIINHTDKQIYLVLDESEPIPAYFVIRGDKPYLKYAKENEYEIFYGMSLKREDNKDYDINVRYVEKFIHQPRIK